MVWARTGEAHGHSRTLVDARGPNRPMHESDTMHIERRRLPGGCRPTEWGDSDLKTMVFFTVSPLSEGLTLTLQKDLGAPPSVLWRTAALCCTHARQAAGAID